jgi:hypothetical protein
MEEEPPAPHMTLNNCSGRGFCYGNQTHDLCSGTQTKMTMTSVHILAKGFIDNREATIPRTARIFLGRYLTKEFRNHECKGHYGVISQRPGPGGSIEILANSEEIAVNLLALNDLKVENVVLRFERKDIRNAKQVKNKRGIVFIPKGFADKEEIKSEIENNPEVSEISFMEKRDTLQENKESVYRLIVEYQEEVKFPKRISIWGALFSVKQYIPPALRCYKCQKFGHTALNCWAGERCLLCSGKHNLNECPEKNKKPEEQTLVCANCKGPHSANSKQCLHYHERTEALKIAYTKNMTYKEALCQVNKITVPSTSHFNVPKEKTNELKQNTSLMEQSTRVDKLEKCLTSVASLLTTICESLIDMLPKTSEKIGIVRNFTRVLDEVLDLVPGATKNSASNDHTDIEQSETKMVKRARTSPDKENSPGKGKNLKKGKHINKT